DVVHEVAAHDRNAVDDPGVTAYEQHVVVTELVVHTLQVQVQVELVFSSRVVLVVAPGRRVEHDLLALGQSEEAAGAFGDRLSVGREEDVVARVTGLEDLALETEGAAQDRGRPGAG